MCASNFQTQFASEIETLYEVTDFMVRQIDPGRVGRTPVRSYTKIMSDVRATTARSFMDLPVPSRASRYRLEPRREWRRSSARTSTRRRLAVAERPSPPTHQFRRKEL